MFRELVNNAKQPSSQIFSQQPHKALNGKLTCDYSKRKTKLHRGFQKRSMKLQITLGQKERKSRSPQISEFIGRVLRGFS